jgi:hypothetical protein
MIYHLNKNEVHYTILVSGKKCKETYVTSDLALLTRRRKSDVKVFVKGEEQVIPLFHCYSHMPRRRNRQSQLNYYYRQEELCVPTRYIGPLLHAKTMSAQIPFPSRFRTCYKSPTKLADNI